MSVTEERVRKIENDIIRAKAIILVLGLLGLGLTAAAAFAWSTLAEIGRRISNSTVLADQLDRRVNSIDAQLDEGIARAVNENGLLISFKNEAVLGQIQAQAICTAIAPKSRTVMAIFRRPTGVTAQGSAVSEKCPDICPRFQMIGTGKTASFVGAVHVYGSLPFRPHEDSVTSAGMATHIYPGTDANPSFGPNYCCCAG